MAKKSASKKVKARKPAARKAAAKKKSAPRKAAASKAASTPRAAPQPKWKPKGTQDVIMNFVVRDAAAAIEFYKQALGAQELSRHDMPNGKIMHAEIRIGDTVVALNDESPMSPTTAAGPNHKPTGAFVLYTSDCDALFNRAIQAGARPTMPLSDMFWGDRMGMIGDPFGQVWMIATHQRDLSEAELRKAGDEAMAQMAAQQQQAPPGGQPPPNAAAH